MFHRAGLALIVLLGVFAGPRAWADASTSVCVEVANVNGQAVPWIVSDSTSGVTDQSSCVSLTPSQAGDVMEWVDASTLPSAPATADPMTACFYFTSPGVLSAGSFYNNVGFTQSQCDSQSSSAPGDTEYWVELSTPSGFSSGSSGGISAADVKQIKEFLVIGVLVVAFFAGIAAGRMR